jgi:hypothetical protein
MGIVVYPAGMVVPLPPWLYFLIALILIGLPPAFIFSGWVYVLGLKLKSKWIKAISLTWLSLAVFVTSFLFYVRIFKFRSGIIGFEVLLK